MGPRRSAASANSMLAQPPDGMQRQITRERAVCGENRAMVDRRLAAPATRARKRANERA
jgi:hypothetical protein